MFTIPAVPAALEEMDEQPASLFTEQLKFVCSLCLDEIPTSSESVTFTACKHRGCRVCIGKWIEKQEASGQASSPTCPFCRLTIHGDEVLAILGRPFKQQEARAGLWNEVDELTLQWLNDQTKLCPGCGSRVEKLDGCNLMTCLCGCEFCFGCGSVRCLCDDEGRPEYPAGEAPIRGRNGIVNLRACIQRRNGSDVQDEREHQRYKTTLEEKNRWSYYPDEECDSTLHHLEPIFTSGMWLFSCRKGSTSAMALMQQYNSPNVREERIGRKQSLQRSIPVHPSWLFESECGSEIRALHLLCCSDVNCDVCHGTEEERESINLQNIRLLF